MSVEDLKTLIERITTHPDMMGGKPVIRDLRFPVVDILELLASGMSTEEIIEEFPFLEPEDIRAALLFASTQIANKVVIHAA